MAEDVRVNHSLITRRFYDRRRNPPQYVDEELPTQTVHIFARRKQGTILDSASGVTAMGSIYFSGSYHNDAPGSYSMRVTRRNVAIGSMGPRPVSFVWKLRHSRLGTVDGIPFYLRGTINQPVIHETVGGPMNPVYAFPPGTIWTYFQPYKGTARVFSSVEGIIG